MKILTKRKTLIVIAIFVIFFSLCFVFSPFRLPLVFSNNSKTASKQLNWQAELNKKQSYNSCASYSTMAYLFAKKGMIADPELINKNISGKMSNNYTYPWGITRYLGKNKIKAKIYYHGLLSDKNRLAWIETKINQDRPVIILIGDRTYLHYITVLGYQDKTFQIYDSMEDGDQNGELAGNKTISKNELLKKWKSAVFKRFPINVAISE